MHSCNWGILRRQIALLEKNSLTNMIQYKLTKKKSIDLLIFIYILYHMCNSKFNVIVIIMALC